MAKKNIVKDFEEGKAVNTQELAEAVSVAPRQSVGFVAYADFEIEVDYQKRAYQAGDMFALPEGWERDAANEEFRNVSANDDLPRGVPFVVPLPVLDEKNKLKYMDSRRVVLPVKEA